MSSAYFLTALVAAEDEITYPGTPTVEHPDKRSGFVNDFSGELKKIVWLGNMRPALG